ncbi:11974_t:CDS:2 [Ambispora gerdemannii]|uniref:11974_t:CDS:1 n=1 Tax=Ambispora gerdemannii TaxID=144530 RepID=A0A9N9BHW7_9GLOM|nr:11974_t:CDS:2 [Ambispora gerdemannii]
MNIQDITDTNNYELYIEVDSAEFKDDNELHIKNEVDCAKIEVLTDNEWEEFLTDDEQEELLTNDKQKKLFTNNKKGKYK